MKKRVCKRALYRVDGNIRVPLGPRRGESNVPLPTIRCCELVAELFAKRMSMGCVRVVSEGSDFFRIQIVNDGDGLGDWQAEVWVCYQACH